MSVTGVGSQVTYIYNSRTGKLSTKDGTEDKFVDYFNGDINGDEDDTLNGYDSARKAEIKNYFEIMSQVDRNLFNDPSREEYEITAEIVDPTTSTVQVDGGKILTCYSGGFFGYIDFSDINKRGPFLTYAHKGYDPSDNSVSIAVGDVFDLGNGYRLRVGADRVYGDGYDSNGGVNEKMTALERGLEALIHFADGQWSSTTVDLMGSTTPMLLELLRQLGVDTDREFILNGTKCEVRGGKIREAGDKWGGVPCVVRDEAIRKYEEEMSRPLSKKNA